MKNSISGYVNLKAGLIKEAIQNQIPIEIERNATFFMEEYNKYASENNNKTNNWWDRLLNRYRENIPLITKNDFSVEINGFKIKIISDNENIKSLMLIWENEIKKDRFNLYFSTPNFVRLYLFGDMNHYYSKLLSDLIELDVRLDKISNDIEVLLSIEEIDLFNIKIG